ncbi:MAG: DUF547 domain-containing protein [Pseudomonadota bacterium]
MSKLVMSMGPSDRSRQARPIPTTGSSILWGHTSSYRLEGTRLVFSLLGRDVIESFRAYRHDLEGIASGLEITTLPRNEQLAFWINLHNVALAEQIALNWPVQEPSNLQIDGVPLQQARFIEIDGARLSLADIRTRIVYPNWRDPRVIYGFWRGTIGGPSLQREAYTAENVSELLQLGAWEFVNSLRGTQRRGGTLLVSSIYDEASPFYFAGGDEGLRAHLAEFAEDDVKDILGRTSRTQATIEVPVIADLAGGMREPHTTPVSINGQPVGFRVPPSVARMLQERNSKLMEMGRERLGTVRVRRSYEQSSQREAEVH